MSKRLIAPLAAMLFIGLSQTAQADQPETGIKFDQWSQLHQEWVETHPKQYQDWIKHPNEAERVRDQWSTWQGPNATLTEFRAFTKDHPDWVATHRARYNFLMTHPDRAEYYRDEWYNWKPAAPNTFRTWAEQHPQWVKEHQDRYDHFLAHPDEAMNSRKEWIELPNGDAKEIRHEEHHN